MRIERIREDSRHLSGVIDLWRRNSATLGYFPEGAFREHAAKRLVFAATGDQDQLEGYLLFRIARRGRAWPKAIVVHLCVEEDSRGKGTAAALVAALRALVKDSCLTIELSCRRDYAANDLWPKLGFTYVDERLGRTGLPISIWQMNLRSLPLLDLLQQKEAQSRLRAVIDANVLFRLQDPLPEKDSPALTLSEEAKALDEAWLSDDVALYVTNETFNEIHRNDDALERDERRSFAQRYPRIDVDLEEVTTAEQALEPLFPGPSSQSTVSDIRQLAHAVAGDAHFFLTQDNGILSKSDAIQTVLGIRVLSPGQLIGHVDEMIREAEYHPERLAGSQVMTAKLRSHQIPTLYAHFRCHQLGERKRQFQKRLRAFMAQPDRYETLLSWQDDERPLSLVVFDRTQPDQLVIPLLRVSRSPLSGTVLRYLLSQAILVSAGEGRDITRVAVQYERDELDGALAEMGFSRAETEWVKINGDLAGPGADLLGYLAKFQEHAQPVALVADTIRRALTKAVQEQDRLALADVERRLWPAKVLDADIPAFVVSIQPVWAQHLFDEEMARLTLWGARADLVLNSENVYYRSSRCSRGISSPARILWYVTHDRRHTLSRHIRACSLLNEVAVGRPKPLFTRFRRLGVYEWHDVLDAAKGNTDNDIMALRFSNTELFDNPVSLEELRETLRDIEGTRPVLQSPQPISHESFARLYEMGTR